MTVSTIVWSPTVQWGGSSVAVWVTETIQSSFPIVGSGAAQINPVVGGFAGIVLDATADQTLTFATVGGVQRPLDPPILLTFSLTAYFAQAIINAGSDNQVEIGVVPDGSPSDYSNSLLPWARSEQSVGTYPLTGLPVFGSEPIAATLSFSTTNATLIRALCTSRGDWTGRLALSMRAAGAHAFDLFNYTGALISASTTQESKFYSGLAGGPTGGGVRAVRDGRFGMPAWNRDLVRDGDNPGLFVRSEDFDPDDEEQTYRPRPGEGTVDDQIPEV